MTDTCLCFSLCMIELQSAQISVPFAQFLPQCHLFLADSRKIDLQELKAIPLMLGTHVEAEGPATRAIIDRSVLTLLHVRPQ